MRTYQAVAGRDGEFWRIRVPVLDRATQAETTGDIRLMARDLVQVMTGEDPDSFTVEVTFAGE